jgi:hypothetical protein
MDECWMICFEFPIGLWVYESDLEHDNFCKMTCFVLFYYGDRLTWMFGLMFEVELHYFESIVSWGQTTN